MNAAIIGRTMYSATFTEPITDGADLLAKVQRYGVRDVWANAATIGNVITATNGLFWESANGQTIAEYTGPQGRVFLHDIDRSPWRLEHIDHFNAETIMRYLDRFTETLRVKSLQHSPNYRFVSSLARTREKTPERFVSEQPEIPGKRPRGMVANWLKPLQHSDKGMFLHKFDMRAAWLACSRTVHVGYGAIEFLDSKRAKTCILHSESGYWNINLQVFPVCPVPIMRPGTYTTGLVLAALNHGQPLDIVNGWHWKGQAETLRPLGEHIIHARSLAMATKDSDESAFHERMYKLLYTRGLGVLERTSKRFPWQHQPHWYFSVQSECVRRVWNMYDCLPGAFAADVDTIYYVTDERDPRMNPAFPVDTFRPGSWRYSGSMVVSQSLAYASRDLSSGAALSRWLRERNCLEKWGG